MSNHIDSNQNALYQQSIDFYDSDAEAYDAKRWTTPAGKYLNEIQIGVVREMIAAEAGTQHLDIATGTGRFAVDIALGGADVTALDSSEGMLTECIKRAEKLGVSGKLTAKCGFANEIGLKDQFDTCTCINALNHIPDQMGVLHSATKALKEDGILVTNYTNWLSFYLPIGVYINLRKKSIHGDVYTKWFSMREIRRLHRDNGLEILEIQGVLHIPTRLKNSILLAFLKAVDRLCRKSIFRFFAPQIYIKARKKSVELNCDNANADLLNSPT